MSKQLYVVRRPFRSGTQLLKAGTVIADISEVKLAKIRLNERNLVELPSDEKELEALKYFVRVKYGGDLDAELAALDSKGSEVAEPEAPKQVTPPPGTVAKPTQAAKPQVVTPKK